MEDVDFGQFIRNIKAKTDIDLSQYKEAQMKRRLTTLRMKYGFTSFAAYWDAMQRDSKLFNEFLDRMTINVSEFWRNPNRWETLERKFLPDMIKRSGRLKIWSAACSTGEEPYTLAMIAARLGILDTTTILATDLDNLVLEKARQAQYHERSVRDVPAAYLGQYLIRKNPDLYEVDARLKKIITFKQQNLLKDTFDTQFDLIVCRNVMIYFTEEAKQMLYHKFAKALKPGGLLFVGSTEQIFSPSQYELESVETFFYRRSI
ncbi:CheR family methyltransferase [Paenibacillus spongiae]|uniref:protein-glutamate O-methyltransferase n=1 Tax=Paenibacillus spongiae TaxID=2909671 RepID=A0ABY5SEI0_9BACL|nr:protein-glutamate O-methyltransferase CheR [Paenibacillus spongiae]UVI32394.1 protein-glutamate O-methyltransferase CheR [Paenibacillus spongiae]